MPMAKSTTTTKAKTKTTKKKAPAKAAAKTTKKTTTKKAAKPTAKAKVTTKPVAAKASATAKPTSSAATSLFKRPQVLLAGLYAVLAVLSGLLMNTASAQVLLGHLAKDDLASRTGTVLAPAATVLYEIEFRWLLVVLFGVAAVIALLRGTKYYARELAGVKAKVQPLRWVEFAITGALAFEVAALLNGLQDFAALKLAMGSIIIAALLAWVFERENAATGKPARATYVASAVAVALPVIALLITMYATYVYGMERSAWYAYAAAAVVAVSLLWTIRLQQSSLRKAGAQGYYFIDRRYNQISALTKVLLAVILIVGLYAK